MSKRALAAGAVVIAATALTACAQRTRPGPVVYKTVTVAPSVVVSPSTSPVAGTPTESNPVHMSKLPGACGDLLSVGTLVNALGHDIRGKTAFVVGLPDSDTGRLSYLNCRYSVTRKAPDGAIEIGVSLYSSAAKAAARVKPTVDDYTAHGATSTAATVAGQPARLLIGGAGADYAPTVVLADGQRTVVVTVRNSSDPSGDLLRLAMLAVRQTAAN